MDKPWFYVRDGQAIGPVPRNDLMQLVRTGELKANTWVYEADTPNWIPAGQIAWLAEALAAAEPPALPAVPASAPLPVARWSNPVTEPAPHATAAPSAATAMGVKPAESPRASAAPDQADVRAGADAELAPEAPKRIPLSVLIGGAAAAITISLGVLMGTIVSGIIGAGDPEDQISREVDKLFTALETGRFVDVYRGATSIRYREWNKLAEHLRLGDTILTNLGPLQAKTTTRFKYQELPTGAEAQAFYDGEFAKGRAEIQVRFRKESGKWLLWDLAVEPGQRPQPGH